MLWNLPGRSNPLMPPNSFPHRNSAPINFINGGMNQVNVLSNGFNPGSRFSFGPQGNFSPHNSPIRNNNVPNSSERRSVPVSHIAADHVHLKKMIKGNSGRKSEPVVQSRQTATFLSEEVRQIVQKIQNKRESRDSGVEIEEEQKHSHIDLKIERSPKGNIESIPEEHEEENAYSRKISKEEEDIVRAKSPNVFTSNKGKVPRLNELDHEKYAVERKGNDGYSIERVEEGQIVNIYSERRITSPKESPEQKEIENEQSFPNSIKRVMNYDDIGGDYEGENLRQIYQNESSSFNRNKSESIENSERSPSNLLPEIQDCSPIDKSTSHHEPPIPKKINFKSAAKSISSEEKKRLQKNRMLLLHEIDEMEKEIQELEAFKELAVSQLERALEISPEKNVKKVANKREKFMSPPKRLYNENPQSDSVFSNTKNYTSIYSIKRDYATSPFRYTSPNKQSMRKNTESVVEKNSESSKIHFDNSKVLKVMTSVERDIMSSIKKKRQALRNKH